MKQNLWKREKWYSWHYTYRREWDTGRSHHTLIRKYGFITYHFIRWIHGDEELIKLALEKSRYE